MTPPVEARPATALQPLSDQAAAGIETFLRDHAHAARRDQDDVRHHHHRIDQRYPETIYPPLVFTEEYYRAIARAAERLLALIGTIPELLFEGDFVAWLECLGYQGDEAAFLIDQIRCTSRPKILSVARGDVMITNGDFKFVELNISPAMGGLGTCDAYVQLMSGLRIWEHLAARGIAIAAPPTDHLWRQAVDELLWQGDPLPARPFLFEAISDPDERALVAWDRPEWIERLQNGGFEVVTGHIEELEILTTGVYHRGRPVNIIYLSFVYQEMLAHGVPRRVMAALGAAEQAHKVNLFTSFGTVAFDSKRNLGLLWRNLAKLSPQDRELVERHVPPTWIFDLASLPEALANKDRYVLKPTNDFGGRGVLVGRNLTQDDWRTSASAALATGLPYVLQQVVDDSWRASWGSGDSDREFTLLAGPLLFGGKFGGMLMRSSPYIGKIDVMNVARGAAFGTAFVDRRGHEGDLAVMADRDRNVRIFQ